MIIDGVKYACEACIKGHRQSNCAHGDRPLREVQKRGRPATACEKCRVARKEHNSHRTCTHMEKKDKSEAHDPLLKTLPNGCKDLASLSLVRRSSSTRSRTSVSSAASRPTTAASAVAASTSTSVASEEELATVGRKKSLSRPPSSRSRGSSSAAQKKPHDLAHGHLADHPTHVSATFSPYPHHAPHHHPPRPIRERSTSSGGSGGGRGAGVGVKDEPQTPAVPPLPPAALEPAHLALPRLASLASQGAPPPPARSYSAPVKLPTPPPLPKSASAAAAPPRPDPPKQAMTTAELASAFFFRGYPEAAPSFSDEKAAGVPPPPPAVPPEQKAIAQSFPLPLYPLPLPPPMPSAPPRESAFAHRPPLPPASATANGEPFHTSPEFDTSVSLPPPPASGYGSFSLPPSFSLPLPPTSDPDYPLYPIDPATAAFVLGPPSERVEVPLAPMFGEGPEHAAGNAEEVYEPAKDSYAAFIASLPSSSSAPSGASSVADFDSDYPTFSAAPSSAYTPHTTLGMDLDPSNAETPLRPPNPAVYGYPLAPVESHTSYTSYSSFASAGTGGGTGGGSASVYSGYESATGGAASLLERLDLDFGAASQPGSGAATSSAASVVAGGGGGASTSASQSHSASGAEGDPLSQTDLDGILEWLASSTAGVGGGAAGGAETPGSMRPPSAAAFASSSFSSASLSAPSSGPPSVSAAARRSFAPSTASSMRNSPLIPNFPTFSLPFSASSSSFSSSAAHAPAPAYPDPAVPAEVEPVSVAVDEAGYEEDDEAEEAEPSLRFVVPSTGVGAGGTVRAPRRRERDPALEMLRTATITCADQSFAAVGDSWGADGDEDDDEDGSPPPSPTNEEVRRRGEAFAARFGSGFDDEAARFSLEEDDLEQFDIGEDWLARRGVGEVHLDFEEQLAAGGSSSSEQADAEIEAGLRVKQEDEDGEEGRRGGFDWWS
ncbi:hypothetical protein JCM10213_003169 [Rhodosporidiobolus nylandii]